MTKKKSPVIAVDGCSSTGKSTVAKKVAVELGLTYIDTGAMYRAVTLYALRNGFMVGDTINEAALKSSISNIHIDLRTENNKSITYLNGECVEKEIREMRVADWVSQIAAIGFVRDYLVGLQREMGQLGGVIMDGRDIGSVVFPNADVKFFLTASVDVRARRRYMELKSKGDDVTLEEVMDNVQKRDYIDTHREVNPMRKTEDAVEIDNSNMSVDEEVELMKKIIEERV